MITVKAECEGRTPYLMDPMNDDVLESLRTGVRKPPKRDRTLEKEAESKLYKEGGVIGIPAENLFACLREAGVFVKFNGKRNISNSEESLLGGLLTIKDVFLPLNHGAKWVVDKRRGVNPGDGSGVCIVRPRFDRWSFEATVQFDEDLISEETVRKLFYYGGIKGMGGHRKKGPFGRFTVAKWIKVVD